MRSLNLRTKFLVGTIGIIMLLGLTMVILVKTFVQERLLVTLQKRGVSIAKNIALNSIAPILTEKFIDLEIMAKELKNSEEDVEYIFIVNHHGDIPAHTFEKGFPVELKAINKADPANQFSIQEIVTEKGAILDIAVPLSKGAIGVLHLGVSERSIRKDVDRIIQLIILIILAVMVVGSLVAIAFEMALTKPVIELAKAAEAVGSGDLEQTVSVKSKDEIGQLGSAFNSMIEMRKQAEAEREKLISELQESLAKVKALSGLLPICTSCKKIRDDKGYWNQVESYISEHSDAEFTHGMCPDCMKKFYPELYGDKQ